MCGVPRCQVLISIIGRYFYQYLRMLLVRGQGRRPGGATPRLRSGAVAESTRLQQCRSSREELPYTRGQGWQSGGAYPRPKPWAMARRSNPISKDRWLHGRRRASRSYSTFKVRRGGGEESPLVQGKEQRLCFAGAAMKRYPTSKVRETQVRR